MGGIENLAQVRFLSWWLVLPFHVAPWLGARITWYATEDGFFKPEAACPGEEEAGLISESESLRQDTHGAGRAHDILFWLIGLTFPSLLKRASAIRGHMSLVRSEKK